MDQNKITTGNIPSFIAQGGELLFPDLRDLLEDRKRLYMRINQKIEFWGFSDDPRIILKSDDDDKEYPEGEE